MAISPGAFKTGDQTKAAFKHLFNVLQTSVAKLNPSDEFHETAHEIFASGLLGAETEYYSGGQTAVTSYRKLQKFILQCVYYQS